MSGPTSAPPTIFDRALIARRQRARDGAGDFVSAMVAEDLADRLAPIMRPFDKALIMGPNARLLPGTARSANGEIRFEKRATLVESGAPMADPERLELPATDYNLIVSLLDLQIVNDAPGFLARIRAHLAPDGLMVLAAIGGNSLQELRAAWLGADAEISGGAFARVAPFIDVRDAGSLLQRTGYALPVTDVEHHFVRYASPLDLMREMHAFGAANPLADRPRGLTTRTTLAAAAAAYQAAAGEPDGRIRATLEILWMSGWAPHESQQQPLRPGSATIGLGEAIGKAGKTGA